MIAGETKQGAYNRGFHNGYKAGMLKVGELLRKAGLNLDRDKNRK